jgi:hypothetical protein
MVVQGLYRGTVGIGPAAARERGVVAVEALVSPLAEVDSRASTVSV